MAALKLVFMGTPDIAVPALDALIAAGHDVVCVYSQPPRPAGRGQRARCPRLDAAFVGECPDRRRPGLAAATRRARRLGVDASDVVSRRDQRGERRYREVRRSHEHQAERGHDQALAFASARFVFASLRRMMLRLRLEM